MNREQMLVIEEELVGNFKGIRFYLNRFLENQAFCIVQKKCFLENDTTIRCIENYSLKDQQIKREYCFFYEYKTSANVSIEYRYDCGKRKNLLQNLFGKEKLRGGGFMLYTQDQDPLNSNKKYFVEFYITKGNNEIFYQQKKYYFLFFFIGSETTIWEKKE